MMNSLMAAIGFVLLFCSAGGAADLSPRIRDVSRQDSRPAPAGQDALRIPHTEDRPRLDGMLDETLWRGALTVELAYEIDPGENIPALVRTECLLITGPAHLFAAFRAYDPNPSAIRAHYTDRDKAWDDDWVLLELDPFLDRRRGFEFLVNPLGIQMDSLINEAQASENQVDPTWDATWESWGRITADGYVVEMAIPYASLRFPGEQGEQLWGFQAVRHYPRECSRYFRANPWDRNRNCILCENMTLVGFERIEWRKNIELIPAAVVRRQDERKNLPDGRIEKGPVSPEISFSARWGIAPNVAVNAALNPDFSQVEADAAQLSINTRFSLFYPEKRPFFMEGADLFGTPLAAVHTRTLADPAWGIKLTAKAGANAVGFLLSKDVMTNLLFPDNRGSRLDFLDRPSVALVLRCRRDLGRQSTLGIIIADRRGKDYANSLLGVDGQLMLGPVDKFIFQALHSRTDYPDAWAGDRSQNRRAFSGWGLNASYLHEARDWRWWAKYERLDRDFRADLGYIPRADYELKEAGASRVLWGDATKWYSRWIFSLKGSVTHDQAGALTDRLLEASAEYSGPYQSALRLGMATALETWDAVAYGLKYLWFESGVKPAGSMGLSLAAKIGDAVDYEGTRPAGILRLQPGITWFIGRRLQLGFEHVWERLAVAEGRLYRVGLSQARVVYQFNLRTFIRAVFQYLDQDRNAVLYPREPDSPDRDVFVQILFSYKAGPQTLVFLGCADNHFGRPGAGLRRKDRTWFLKVSYAWNMMS